MINRRFVPFRNEEEVAANLAPSAIKFAIGTPPPFGRKSRLKSFNSSLWPEADIIPHSWVLFVFPCANHLAQAGPSSFSALVHKLDLCFA